MGTGGFIVTIKPADKTVSAVIALENLGKYYSPKGQSYLSAVLNLKFNLIIYLDGGLVVERLDGWDT